MKKIIETDIVIIGGGLTGLTAAYYLSKANVKVKIVEKENRVGGAINTSTEKGYIFEEGPNTGIISNEEVVDLFDQISDKCKLEIASDNVKKRYVLKKGKWSPLPMGIFSAIFTPLFTWFDKFRVLLEPFRKPGTNPDETLASLVKRRLGKSFLNYAIDPFILGVYAGDPNFLVPKYALPKLYNLEQDYGSFIGGSVKKAKESRGKSKSRVTRKVFSFENGLISLVNVLANQTGSDNIICNAKSTKIEKQDDSYLINTKTDTSEYKIKAKKIISTIGAYGIEEVFNFIDHDSLKDASSLLYTRVIEVIIGFDKWDGMKLDGFGGLIPHIENRDLLGVLFISSLFENRAPKDGALFSIFLGGVRNQKIIEYSDEKIKQILEDEFKNLMGVNDFNPELLKITRHEKAIPQYGTESKERLAAIKNIEEKNRGLFIAGNLRDGIGMADRIKQGKNIAETIINKK